MEVYHVVRSGRLETLDDLSSVKKGERFRICTLTFDGPWRVAAADANKTCGKWTVKLTSSNKKRTNGYDG